MLNSALVALNRPGSLVPGPPDILVVIPCFADRLTEATSKVERSAAGCAHAAAARTRPREIRSTLRSSWPVSYPGFTQENDRRREVTFRRPVSPFRRFSSAARPTPSACWRYRPPPQRGGRQRRAGRLQVRTRRRCWDRSETARRTAPAP